MDHTKPREPEERRQCIVCGRDADAIDRTDTAMCAKHAALFLTRDHRETVADRPRVVR